MGTSALSRPARPRYPCGMEQRNGVTPVIVAAVFAVSCALAPSASAEYSPEAQASLAAQDFDLSAVRDAATSMKAGGATPLQELRSMAAGKGAVRPALAGAGLPDTSRGMDLRPATRKSPEPPAPPKTPSRLKGWLGDKLGAAKDALKRVAWFAPTVAGVAIGGFAGATVSATVGGPVGVSVGAAIGGAAIGGAVGVAVTGVAFLVKLVINSLDDTWNRR